MTASHFDSNSNVLDRSLLLEQLQQLSVAILKATIASVGSRIPGMATTVQELAGGVLGFSGPEIPFTRAIGVGTSRPADRIDVEAIEMFYRERSSPVRMVISERTHILLPNILKRKGYESGGFLQNWWLPLTTRKALPASQNVEILPARRDQAEQWARTVAAGFEEECLPIDDRRLSEETINTFYCLGFSDGAHAFFAKLDGVIAGGGVLHIAQQTASIRTTSCRLQYRNKGVQRALLAYRLEEAAKAGCRYAFSSTDKLGASSRNLRNFGFRTLSRSFTMTSPA
jgi:N-acetylglutamate synthase-like GNAT family acetyltransferase